MTETRRFGFCNGWVYGTSHSPDPRVNGEEVIMEYAGDPDAVPHGWERISPLLWGEATEGQDIAITVHRAPNEERPSGDALGDLLLHRLMELVEGDVSWEDVELEITLQD